MTTYRLISFGLGGHHAEAVCPSSYNPRGTCSISGYERPETFWRDHKPEHRKNGEKYAREDYDIPDGTPVIDLREAVDRKPSLAYLSPLCNPNLDGDTVDRCPEPSGILVAAVAGNAYGNLLNLADVCRRASVSPGPLDSVSPAYLVDWWRARGARIGQVRGASFVWENGEVTI